MFMPAAVLGLEEKLDDETGKQLPLAEVRRALEKRTVGFAARDHLVGQHLAVRRGEPIRPTLRVEGHRNLAGLQQAEHIARGLRRDFTLVRNDVVLGTIASGDVILG